MSIEQGDEAARLASQSLKLAPDLAEAHHALGLGLHLSLRLDEAAAEYKRALELDPNHAGAHQNAGRTLFARNRFSEAVVHYEYVQRLQPTSAVAHYDLGLALASTGNIDRAAHHFAEALRLRPNAHSYVNYARFLANAGRTADALAALEAALRLQPDFEPARSELERLRGR